MRKNDRCENNEERSDEAATTFRGKFFTVPCQCALTPLQQADKFMYMVFISQTDFTTKLS